VVSQNVIPHKKFLGGSTPFGFTETGVAMLSGVLKSASIWRRTLSCCPIWSKNFIEVKASFGASVSGGLSVLAMLVAYTI